MAFNLTIRTLQSRGKVAWDWQRVSINNIHYSRDEWLTSILDYRRLHVQQPSQGSAVTAPRENSTIKRLREDRDRLREDRDYFRGHFHDAEAEIRKLNKRLKKASDKNGIWGTQLKQANEAIKYLEKEASEAPGATLRQRLLAARDENTLLQRERQSARRYRAEAERLRAEVELLRGQQSKKRARSPTDDALGRNIKGEPTFEDLRTTSLPQMEQVPDGLSRKKIKIKTEDPESDLEELEREFALNG